MLVFAQRFIRRCSRGGLRDFRFKFEITSSPCELVQSIYEFLMVVKKIATEYFSPPCIKGGPLSNILEVPQHSFGGTCQNWAFKIGAFAIP